MATKPPIGPDSALITNEALDVRVAVDLDTFYNRLLNATRELLTDYQQRGLAGAELATAMEKGFNDLGDTLIDQMGRGATAEAFNLGRNIAAQEAAGEIKECVRTEILDVRTCDPCGTPAENGGLDGKVVEFNSDDYFEFMPPNGCDGGDFCRGFYLYRT